MLLFKVLRYNLASGDRELCFETISFLSTSCTNPICFLTTGSKYGAGEEVLNPILFVGFSKL